MSSVTERLSAVPLKWLGIGVSAVAILVSTAFGGLHPVKAHGPVTVPPGHAVTGEPWDVTVVSARVVASQDHLETQTKGDHWLIVIATVTVTSDDSRLDLGDALRLKGVRDF